MENADEGIISDHGTVSLKKVQEAETQEGRSQGHFALYIKWHIYKLQYIKVKKTSTNLKKKKEKK